MADLKLFSQQSADACFDLPLDNGSKLSNLRVVRRVPNKRLVCAGDWNGQPVYAKIFIGSQAQRYAARDGAGVNRLEMANIQTPALLYSGDLDSGQLVDNTEVISSAVLIYAAIVDGINAEEAWARSVSHEKLELAKKLVTEVARHHQAGLMQTDLYLKNFLVAGDKIFTLDGDAIKPLPKLFTKQAALGNLAILLSKFDVVEVQQWLELLLQVYVKARGWNQPINTKRIRALIMRQRHHAVNAYAEKKVFRQCTDVTVSRSWSHFLAMSQVGHSEELEHVLLKLPDSLIDGPNQQKLKSGNTCTVTLSEINGRKVVVKRYNIKSFWHLIGRFWRPSRAANSWSNAHRLLMHSIATAKPVALLEQRFGPLRGKAYFIADYIEAPNLADFMQEALHSGAQKQTVLLAVAELMHKLLLLQIVHGDMKASNIHIEDSRPILIDLDSLQQYKCKARFAAGHVRDLKRLIRNWENQLEVKQWLIAALKKVYGDHSLLAKALKV